MGAAGRERTVFDVVRLPLANSPTRVETKVVPFIREIARDVHRLTISSGCIPNSVQILLLVHTNIYLLLSRQPARHLSARGV